MLTALDHQELNRLARSQATGPRTASTGRWRTVGVTSQRSTSAICALYQFMKALIDRLIVR